MGLGRAGLEIGEPVANTGAAPSPCAPAARGRAGGAGGGGGTVGRGGAAAAATAAGLRYATQGLFYVRSSRRGNVSVKTRSKRRITATKFDTATRELV